MISYGLEVHQLIILMRIREVSLAKFGGYTAPREVVFLHLGTHRIASK